MLSKYLIYKSKQENSQKKYMFAITKAPSIAELTNMWQKKTVDLSYLTGKKSSKPMTNYLHHWLSKLLFERLILFFIGGLNEKDPSNVTDMIKYIKQLQKTKVDLYNYSCKCLYLILFADTARAEDKDVSGEDLQQKNKKFIETVDKLYGKYGKRQPIVEEIILLKQLKTMLKSQKNNFFDDRFTNKSLYITSNQFIELRSGLVKMIEQILDYMISK